MPSFIEIHPVSKGISRHAVLMDGLTVDSQLDGRLDDLRTDYLCCRFFDDGYIKNNNSINNNNDYRTTITANMWILCSSCHFCAHLCVFVLVWVCGSQTYIKELGILQIQIFSHALYIKTRTENTVILLTFLTVVVHRYTSHL